MKIEAEKLRLYAVTDRSWLKEGETLAGILEEMLDAGVTCVQLREKKLDDTTFLEEAKIIGALCRRYGVPFIVNDRPDIAKESGADGVHVGLSDMGIEKARAYLGDGFIIGGSAHNVQEALAVKIPAVAIGGIRLDNVQRLKGSGIAGVAVISGLFAAEDKKQAVRDFLKGGFI